jgi:hypothetical protein
MIARRCEKVPELSDLLRERQLFSIHPFLHSATMYYSAPPRPHPPKNTYKDKDYSLPLPPLLPVAVTGSNVQRQHYGNTTL